MKFLELTTGDPTCLERPCLVNLYNVTDIHEKAGGGCTIYFNGDQNHLVVKESLEKIQEILTAP